MQLNIIDLKRRFFNKFNLRSEIIRSCKLRWKKKQNKRTPRTIINKKREGKMILEKINNIELQIRRKKGKIE